MAMRGIRQSGHIVRTDLSRYKVGPGTIHYRRKYTFSPILAVDDHYRSVINDIKAMDRLLGRIVLSESDYASAIKNAYSTNVAHTFEEGRPLSISDDVADLVDKLHESTMADPDDISGVQREVLNYVTTFISASHGRVTPKNVDDVVRIHKKLMRGVSDDIVPGEIRDDSYAILDDSGMPRVITCPPEYIKAELQSLLQWVRGSPYDSIATAVIFFAEFVGIRPFTHASNRVGSVLSQLIMHSMGLENIGFTLYESMVYCSIERFNDLLVYSLREQNYYPLVLHICESIHEAYCDAIESLSPKDMLSDSDAYMKVIAHRAKYNEGVFSVSDCMRWIPDVKEQTVRTKLNTLVDKGVLSRKGNTRNTRYWFVMPFSDLVDPLGDKGGEIE